MWNERTMRLLGLVDGEKSGAAVFSCNHMTSVEWTISDAMGKIHFAAWYVYVEAPTCP